MFEAIEAIQRWPEADLIAICMVWGMSRDAPGEPKCSILATATNFSVSRLLQAVYKLCTTCVRSAELGPTTRGCFLLRKEILGSWMIQVPLNAVDHKGPADMLLQSPRCERSTQKI